MGMQLSMNVGNFQVLMLCMLVSFTPRDVMDFLEWAGETQLWFLSVTAKSVKTTNRKKRREVGEKDAGDEDGEKKKDDDKASSKRGSGKESAVARSVARVRFLYELAFAA